MPAAATIESLYTAAVGHCTWKSAMTEIAADIGADIVAAFNYSLSPTTFTHVSNASADVDDVLSTWPVVAKEHDRFRDLLYTLPPGSVRLSEGAWSISSYLNSAFYSDYARLFGGRHIISVDLERSPQRFINLFAYSAGRTGVFDSQITKFSIIARHFQAALKVDRTLTRERLQHGFAIAALESLATPVFVIDDSGRLVFSNRPADEFIAGANGLDLSHGRLCAATAQPYSLQAALRQIVVEPRPYSSAQTLSVDRPGKPPLTLTVLPTPIETQIWAQSGASMGGIVFVADTASEFASIGGGLRRLYGLTEREAKTALDLANGLDTTTIARRSQVGVDTVRKQLKHAFRKTGTSRQAELVRLVLMDFWRHRQLLESLSDGIVHPLD